MLANFILTIPQFPLLVVLAGLISFQDRFYLALLLAVLDWPSLMRAVRAQVLSLRERDYVEAAVVLDLGLPHIMLREVLPQMISYISINMIFSIQGAMYAIVGLVFLGMVPFTEPDWGVMIFMGRSQGALFSRDAASMLLSPVIAVALFQLSLVLFTRSLEEVFNPGCGLACKERAHVCPRATHRPQPSGCLDQLPGAPGQGSGCQPGLV